MNAIRTAMLVAVAAALAAGAASGGEIDDLAVKVKPAARYQDYRADFRAEVRRFTFHHAGGKVEEKDWRAVLDGDKVVALLRSGDINLIARCPDLAKKTLDITTGRYHLDAMLGASLPTWQWLRAVKVHGAIYAEGEAVVGPEDRWEGGGETLTLVRELKAPPDRHVVHRFVFRVDPVFGYRVDGHYDAGLKELPTGKDRKFTSGAFCPGCYTVWPETAIYDRTVVTPAGTDGFHGYANNVINMDRFDGDRDRTTWRKNGFIAYLDPKTGWSVVRTRCASGGVPRMPICNAHNDFHIHIPLDEQYERGPDGLYHLRFHHRLMALPPEMTRYVWDHMEMPSMGGPKVFIRFGRVEDFEDQPIPLDQPTRGLAWTSGDPSVTTDEAHSGRRSLELRRTSWPNLPQVALKPNSTYRLEAWLKVRPLTYDERKEAREKHEARRRKRIEQGKDAPPPYAEPDGPAEAYIKGDFYEWSPHSRKWLREQRTTGVRAGQGWKRAELVFDTPEWDPFINLVFCLDGEGVAYLDDFSLTRLGEAE